MLSAYSVCCCHEAYSSGQGLLLGIWGDGASLREQTSSNLSFIRKASVNLLARRYDLDPLHHMALSLPHSLLQNLTLTREILVGFALTCVLLLYFEHFLKNTEKGATL